MARRTRIQFPDALYHITARGNRKQDVFAASTDADRFLGTVADVVERFGWQCHAYCLMPNHYHLVMETPKPNLSAGMQSINGRYAQWFNRRYRLDGHLFQGRFHAVLVESTWHLLELSRYVVLNPVRGGLCEDPADWRWSSYRAMAGFAPRPRFLAVDRCLFHFGETPARAREAFVRFIRDGLPGRPTGERAHVPGSDPLTWPD